MDQTRTTLEVCAPTDSTDDDLDYSVNVKGKTPGTFWVRDPDLDMRCPRHEGRSHFTFKDSKA